MNNKFEQLKNLGAGEFEHLNGSLIEHLNATKDLLVSWQASLPLCDAGLYHAAYGTAGFDSQVVPLSQRADIAEIIGNDAEQIVYLYCACDRNFVFNNLGKSAAIKFKDRFTEEEFELTPLQAKQFCELTAANELELAIASKAFIQEHGQGLLALFTKMAPFLSAFANKAVKQVLLP